MAIIELVAQGIALGAMLATAFLFHSIWALVVGAIVSALVRVVASHVFLAGHTNKFQWSHDAWLGIFHFGKWIFLSSAIGFLVGSGDRLIFGAIVDPVVLGIYSIAMLLLSVVYTAYYSLVGSVVFPALSEVVRDRPHELARAYGRFQLQADLVLFGMAGMLLLAGPSVVRFLYDARYSDAGEMLAILSFGLIGARYVIAEHCFLAMGQVRLQVISNVCRILVLCVSLPVGAAMFGVNGALGGIVLTQFASWPIAIYFEKRRGLFEWTRLPIGLFIFIGGTVVGWIASMAITLLASQFGR